MTSTPQRDLNEQKTQGQDYFSRTAESYVASFSHRGETIWGDWRLAI